MNRTEFEKLVVLVTEQRELIALLTERADEDERTTKEIIRRIEAAVALAVEACLALADHDPPGARALLSKLRTSVVERPW
jgi:hypothetical protein